MLEKKLPQLKIKLENKWNKINLGIQNRINWMGNHTKDTWRCFYSLLHNPSIMVNTKNCWRVQLDLQWFHWWLRSVRVALLSSFLFLRAPHADVINAVMLWLVECDRTRPLPTEATISGPRAVAARSVPPDTPIYCTNPSLIRCDSCSTLLRHCVSVILSSDANS